MAVDKERLEAAARNSAGKKGRAKGGVRLLRAIGPAELGKVASAMQTIPATQGLWLGGKEVESQVIGEDRSQPSGR